ncbi:MAG TPA: sugar phosphate isomerase/epimerase family protein [Candidatus Hydrogenedentes bacterium]|nr:sugar phosphate isomerase/epimerase family protein [Candidatus Hydrogenedentota bacterium]
MKKPSVCAFSKHLQFLDWAALGKTGKALGLDGIDLTVREGGHVVPDKVAADLPRAVEAIRAEGLDVPMITTRLNDGGDPNARPILEAAAKAGIRYFRIGGLTYGKSGNPLEQLGKFTDGLRSLAQLAGEYGLTAGYHNHSGYNQVGAAIWDLHRMITDVGSERLGSNFDVGHAVVEGAYGAWQVNARLIAPHVRMMAVKDFVWDKDRPKWAPLGEGIVKFADCFAIMREAGFAGPVSIHFEYKTASNDALLDDIRKAVQTLRANLREAGYDV